MKSSNDGVLTAEKLVEHSVKGATKATLEHGEEKILNWIEKFKNKELLFIGDRETIIDTSNQRKIN